MLKSINHSRNNIIEKNFKLYQREVKKILIKNRKSPERILKNLEALFESSFFKRISFDIELMLEEKTLINEEGILGAAFDAVNPLDNVGDGAITHAKKVMIMGIIKSIPPLPGGWDFSKLVNNETILGKSILDFFANLDTNAMLAIPKIVTGSVKSSDKLCEAYSIAFAEAVCTFLILGAVTGALKAGEAAEASEEAMESFAGQGILAALKQTPNPYVKGVIIAVEYGIKIGAFVSKHLGALIKGLSDSNTPLGAISFESILQTVKKDVLGKVISFISSTFDIENKICEFIDSFYTGEEEEINPFTGRPTGVKDKKYNIKSNRYKIDKSKYKIDKSKYGIKESKKFQMRKKDMKKILDEKTIRSIIRKKLIKEGAAASGFYAINSDDFDTLYNLCGIKFKEVIASYNKISSSGFGHLAMVSTVGVGETQLFTLSNNIKMGVEVKTKLNSYLETVTNFLRLCTGGDSSRIIQYKSPKTDEFTVQGIINKFLNFYATGDFKTQNTASPIYDAIASGGYLEMINSLPVGIKHGVIPASIPPNLEGAWHDTGNLANSFYEGTQTMTGTDEYYLKMFGKGQDASGAQCADTAADFNLTLSRIDKFVPTKDLSGLTNWSINVRDGSPTGRHKALYVLCNEADRNETADGHIDPELGGIISLPLFEDLSGTQHKNLEDFLNIIEEAVDNIKNVLNATRSLEDNDATAKNLRLTDISTKKNTASDSTAIKIAKNNNLSGKFIIPKIDSEDPLKDGDNSEDGGGGTSGDGSGEEESEAQKNAEKLANERMIIDQETEKLKSEAKRIKAEMELNQLQKQKEYESTESQAARLKERERVIREMRRNPVGLCTFPVHQTRISETYKRSVELEGSNAGASFAGIPSVSPTWGSGPYTADNLFNTSGDWYRNVQYLIPLLKKSVEPSEQEKNEAGDVNLPNILMLDETKTSMVVRGVKDVSNASVKTITQKAINTVMNHIKVTRLILKQKFLIDFRVTGIFDAYTKKGSELQNSDLIFLKGSAFSNISSQSYGKALDVKTIKDALKSGTADEKSLFKNFNQIRFFNLNNKGMPINENKIKINVKGAFLGMLEDNIFKVGPKEIAQIMRNVIMNIVQEELLNISAMQTKQFYISSQDLTLRCFSRTDYEQGLLFYLDSIDFQIRFDPGEYKTVNINETKILPIDVLRKIIRNKLIKEATSKNITFSRIDIDNPYGEDFFDNKGYQEDLSNLVSIDDLELKKEIKVLNSDENEVSIEGCTIYTIKINGIKDYQEVATNTGKRKKAIPDNNITEFKIATHEKVSNGKKELDPYFYDKEKDKFIKIPAEKQKTYFELILYGKPNDNNIDTQTIKDAVKNIED